MGVQDAARLLQPGKGHTDTLHSIRHSMVGLYPLNGDSHPLVLIDTSIFLVPALKRKESLCQFFNLPPTPVTSVANSVEAICKLLVANKFRPCLVLDGASYPPKAATSQARYGDLPEEIRKLEHMYAAEEISMDELFKQQKKAVHVRPDIIYEILKMAKANSFRIIGAPFEADSQIVSLLNQGVGEFAVTNDSDIPFQGATKSIMQLSLSGKCCLVDKVTVLSSLKGRLGSERDVDVRDLAVFAAMCGNDYVNRAAGCGIAYAENCMKIYVTLSTETQRKELLQEHLNKLPKGEQEKFHVSLYSWEQAPAFIIVPTSHSDTPIQAFDKGTDHFQVRLGPMSHVSIDQSTWEEGLGFPVEEKLRLKHPASRHPPAVKEMFQVKVWSRTGLPLQPVAPLLDADGRELLPYSIIDFKARPARCLAATVLRTYLVARGINLDFEDHNQLVAKVEEVASDPNVPLPRFLFRGQGGYPSHEVLAPRNDGEVFWAGGEEVLHKIRHTIPRISDEWFTRYFGIRNSSRYRCLKHLKGGSYDLKDLEFTEGLHNKLNPDSELVVFRASCAPSQRLGGGDTYSLTCVFEKGDNNQYNYLSHPLSQCDCYNGHTFDAHKGGLLLLMFVLQQRPSWGYEKCLSMLPESIHLVVSQPIFVSYVYPSRVSQEAVSDAKIRKQTLQAASVALGDDNSDSDSDSDSVCSLSNENDDNLGGDVPDTVHWANPLMANPVRDVASAPPVPVCQILLEWIAEMETSEELTGKARRLASARLAEASVKRAQVVTDRRRIKLQMVRLLRLRAMTEDDPQNRRCLLSHYVEVNKTKIEDNVLAAADVDETYRAPDIYGQALEM